MIRSRSWDAVGRVTSITYFGHDLTARLAEFAGYWVFKAVAFYSILRSSIQRVDGWLSQELQKSLSNVMINGPD